MTSLLDQALSIWKSDPKDILIVAGPTASGKSSLGIELALQLGGEIISADSRQVFRGMDVGTGKVTEEEMRGVPHHMIDIVDPDQRFTVADFVSRTHVLISDMLSRKILPIIVGGTGLYLTALLEGFTLAGDRDPALRAELEERVKTLGIDVLYEELKKKSPAIAERVSPCNPRHVVNALETILRGATPSSAIKDFGYGYTMLAIDTPRDVLSEKINKRHAEMFVDNALIKETKTLLSLGFTADQESMTSIGYKEAGEYLAGVINLEEAVCAVQSKARQYAKRQRTWLRRMERRGTLIHWITAS